MKKENFFDILKKMQEEWYFKINQEGINLKQEHYGLYEKNNKYIIRNNMKDFKKFQKLIENRNEAIKIINYVLTKLEQENIEENEIKIYKNSYASLTNLNGEACIVYMDEKNKGIYYLLQVKQKVDYKMNYQVMECYAGIVKSLKDNRNIPLLIPCVLYIGDAKWDAYTKIEDGQPNFSCKNSNGKVLTLGSYILVDYRHMSNSQLMRINGITPKIIALQNSNGKKKLLNTLKMIDESKLTKEEIELLNEYIYMEMCERSDNKKALKVLEWLMNKEDEMGLVDIFNMQILKEIKKAKKEEKEEIAIKMKENNISDEMIKKITGINMKNVN